MEKLILAIEAALDRKLFPLELAILKETYRYAFTEGEYKGAEDAKKGVRKILDSHSFSEIFTTCK